MTPQPPPTDADMAWIGFFTEIRRLAALDRARRADREQSEELETANTLPD